MRYIIAATAFALVAGITLGFVVSRGLDGSASAAPPTQAVEEQNLDAGGSIAVHEQGVADVNVTNPSLPVSGTVDVGNLPAVQDVNVISLPSQPAPVGRTVLVAQNVNLGPGASHTTAIEETADCRDMRLMVDHTGQVAALLLPSPDGASQTGAIELMRSGGGDGTFYTPKANPASSAPFSATAPKVAIRLTESTGSVAATVNEAWLYCSR